MAGVFSNSLASSDINPVKNQQDTDVEQNKKRGYIEETKRHQENVKRNMLYLIGELRDRSKHHDESKLKDPELTGYAKAFGQRKDVEYGSEEWKKQREKLKPIINHHYDNNRHHPEHFNEGINGMTIIDLIEMLSDWYDACNRTKDGDIYESIEYNQERFGYSDNIKNILINTAQILEDK